MLLGDEGYYDTLGSSKMNGLAGDASGRLLKWDAATRSTKLLLDGIWFANGVALSPDESFVLVAETFGARVIRHWLRGRKKGKTDDFVDRLPGFPDGVHAREGGGYWVALVNAPSALALLFLLPPHASRALRSLSARLLPWLEPLVPQWGCVAKLGAKGERLALLMDSKGEAVRSIAAVAQSGRRLFMGSLSGDYVSYIDLEPGE